MLKASQSNLCAEVDAHTSRKDHTIGHDEPGYQWIGDKQLPFADYVQCLLVVGVRAFPFLSIDDEYSTDSYSGKTSPKLGRSVSLLIWSKSLPRFSCQSDSTRVMQTLIATRSILPSRLVAPTRVAQGLRRRCEC